MKALYFGFPAQGHVNPSLAVVSELAARGEQIVYYNAESWRYPVEQTGAIFRAYPPLRELSLLGDPAPGSGYASLAPFILEASEQLLPSMLQELDREHPDYIMYDSMAGWGKLAAQAIHIPNLAFITTLVFGPNLAMPPINWRGAIEITADIARFLPVYWRISRRLRR